MAENSADTGSADTTSSTDELEALRAELATAKSEANRYKAESQSERNGRLQAEQRGMSETERRIAADESACKASIDSLNGEADTIEAEIARLADEPGHGAEIAKLNRRLAIVVNKASTEENRATWLAGQREQAKAKSAEATDNKTEKLANGSPISQFAPEVQTWFRKHPECFTDKAYLNKAIAIAGMARDVENLPENTPEYFAYVDEQLGGQSTQRRDAQQKQEDDEGEDLETELTHTVKNPQTRAAGPGSMRQAAVAPPSRSAVTPSGTNPRRQALLSADEREVADKLYADKFKNPADRYAQYASDKKYMAERHRHGFGAN